MIDTDKYEGHTEGKWDITVDIAMEGSYFFRQGYDREQEGCDYDECDANARLMSDAPLLLAEVKRLQKKVKKLNWVLTDLDEKIQNYESHVELMKAFEQGLELPETWKEMVE